MSLALAYENRAKIILLAGWIENRTMSKSSSCGELASNLIRREPLASLLAKHLEIIWFHLLFDGYLQWLPSRECPHAPVIYVSLSHSFSFSLPSPYLPRPPPPPPLSLSLSVSLSLASPVICPGLLETPSNRYTSHCGQVTWHNFFSNFKKGTEKGELFEGHII